MHPLDKLENLLGKEQKEKLLSELEIGKATALTKLKALAAPIVAALALAGMTALGLDHSAQEEAVSAVCKAAATQIEEGDTDSAEADPPEDEPKPDVGETL